EAAADKGDHRLCRLCAREYRDELSDDVARREPPAALPCAALLLKHVAAARSRSSAPESRVPGGQSFRFHFPAARTSITAPISRTSNYQETGIVTLNKYPTCSPRLFNTRWYFAVIAFHRVNNPSNSVTRCCNWAITLSRSYLSRTRRSIRFWMPFGTECPLPTITGDSRR